MNYPIINETLQIEDSDEEEEDNKEKMEYIDEKNFEFIKENIDNVIMDTLKKFNIDKRLQSETEYLKSLTDKVEGIYMNVQ